MPCIMHHFRLLLLSFLLLTGCREQQSLKPESHALNLVKQITTSKERLAKRYSCSDKGNRCLFLTFWDFDGTILRGDCSEGLQIDGKHAFKGMAQAGIEAGLSKRYEKHEFSRFWSEYKELESRDHIRAYVMIPAIFAGSPVSQLNKLGARQFSQSYRPWYFTSSVYMIEELKKAGIENHIISASGDVFVKNAAQTLPIPAGHMHGIELVIEKGILTGRPVQPITYAAGKTRKLEQVVAQRVKQLNAAKVFILAGFGNSYGTDGHFLKYISKLKYGEEKTTVVMINGGEPESGYEGLFHRVKQQRVLEKTQI